MTPQLLLVGRSMSGFLGARNFGTSGDIGDDARILIHKKIVRTYLVTGSLMGSRSLRQNAINVRICCLILSILHALSPQCAPQALNIVHVVW